MHSNFL